MVITDHVSTESRYGTKSFLRFAAGCVECSDNMDITLPSMCSEVLMLTPSYTVTVNMGIMCCRYRLTQFTGTTKIYYALL